MSGHFHILQQLSPAACLRSSTTESVGVANSRASSLGSKGEEGRREKERKGGERRRGRVERREETGGEERREEERGGERRRGRERGRIVTWLGWIPVVCSIPLVCVCLTLGWDHQDAGQCQWRHGVLIH